MSESTESWAQGGHLLRFDGAPVFFKRAGAGPRLLLIHGTPVGSYDWHLAWPHLCDCFNVIAPDLPGMGASRLASKRRPTVAELTDFLEQLLRGEGWTSFYVVAHGLGVPLAQELMSRDAQSRVRRVLAAVLLNGPAFAEAWQPRLRDRMSLTRAGRLLRLKRGKASFERSVRAMFGTVSPPTEDLVAGLLELAGPDGFERYSSDAAALVESARRRRDALVAPLLEKRIPLRFISGEADQVMGRAMAERYKRLCPDADVVRLAEVGHWPQLEVPRLVVGYIAQKLLYVRRERDPRTAAGA